MFKSSHSIISLTINSALLIIAGSSWLTEVVPVSSGFITVFALVIGAGASITALLVGKKIDRTGVLASEAENVESENSVHNTVLARSEKSTIDMINSLTRRSHSDPFWKEIDTIIKNGSHASVVYDKSKNDFAFTLNVINVYTGMPNQQERDADKQKKIDIYLVPDLAATGFQSKYTTQNPI